MLEILLHGYGDYVSDIKDPGNLDEVEMELKKTKYASKLAIVVTGASASKYN